MKNIISISECPQCEAPIGQDQFTSRPHLDGLLVAVDVECSYCSFTYELAVPPAIYKQWLDACKRDIQARRRQRELSLQQEALQEKRRRLVGRIVAGFRVDLDVIDTLDDLQLYWHDQDTWAGHTIIREHADGRHAHLDR